MTEMVFLPDRNANKDEAVKNLARSTLAAEHDPATFDLGALTVDMLAASANPAGVVSAVLGFSAPVAAAGKRRRGAKGRRRAKRPDMEIVDVVAQSGAALVKVKRNAEVSRVDGGEMCPVVHYQPAIATLRAGRSAVGLNSGPSGADFLSVRLVRASDGKPLVGAVANLRPRGARQTFSAVSDRKGVVTFGLRAPALEQAMFLVEPGFGGHWGLFFKSTSLANKQTFKVEEIGLDNAPDALRKVLSAGPVDAGAGIRVGVVDSGIGPHPHLAHAQGDRDSSIGHGTHVAGIIGGRGPDGYGGIAPGVELRSYRVFDDPATGLARNFDVHRAIEHAVADGCHLVNLSLKLEPRSQPRRDDRVLARAIDDAWEAGVVCIAAAGNDFRRFVAFPARHDRVIAVSALGWEPGMPDNAYDRWTVSRDRGDPDGELYFASFSNEGVDNTQVQIIGPGAGIVSTVPGSAYAPMSGTSMACPAMTGTISRILAARPDIVSMPADAGRAAAMRQVALQTLRSLGFGAVREGGGMVE